MDIAGNADTWACANEYDDKSHSWMGRLNSVEFALRRGGLPVFLMRADTFTMIYRTLVFV